MDKSWLSQLDCQPIDSVALIVSHSHVSCESINIVNDDEDPFGPCPIPAEYEEYFRFNEEFHAPGGIWEKERREMDDWESFCGSYHDNEAYQGIDGKTGKIRKLVRRGALYAAFLVASLEFSLMAKRTAVLRSKTLDFLNRI